MLFFFSACTIYSIQCGLVLHWKMFWKPWPLQYLLQKAAKARIDRMVKDHPQKPHLNVAEWLREEWRTGRKDDIAQVLQSVNFSKAP